MEWGPDRWRLVRLAIGEMARAVRASLRRLVGAFGLFGRTAPDRLLFAPQDLRTADPTRASEIYAGRFALAGKIVICDGRSPFEMVPPSDEWATQLLGFGWLRHLRAADSAITRANARALIDDWISKPIRKRGIGWRADVLARRVISLLSQARRPRSKVYGLATDIVIDCKLG